MRDLRPALRPGFPRPSMLAGRFGGGGDGGGGSLRWPSFDSEDGGPPWMLFLVAAAGTAAAQPWVRRGIRFWLGVGPILASYVLLLLQASLQGQSVAVRQERLAAHHEKCAPRALRLVQQLAGGYIKMGQVLSNRADVLPLPYVLCFGVLQDQVPPRPWPEMERQLRRDAPALWRELRSVDPAPLGAASTGQVHRCTLRDGRDCAVKLQYAEAQRQFGADFANVARLARLALPALVPVVKEVRRRFQSEFDYAREAQDMMLIRDALRPFRRALAVPRAYPELGGRRVLVMEYLPGEKMMSAVQRRAAAALGESGYAWARARALELPPPRGARRPTRLQLLRAAPSLWRLRRQTRRTLATLVKVKGYEIFRVGVFNADPHPGNVLLMPCGRLGLIDYGQVVHLSTTQRRELASLTLALARRGVDAQAAPEALAAAAARMGFATRRMERAVLAELCSVLFDRDVAGESPARVLKRLDARDRIVRIPQLTLSLTLSLTLTLTLTLTRAPTLALTLTPKP